MADTESMPDIDGMDDKAFDALKSDMMAGKDVSVKPEIVDPIETGDEPEIIADEVDEPDEPIVTADGEQPQKQTSVPFERFDKTRHQLKEERAARAAEKAEFEARDRERQARVDDIIKSFAPKPVEAEPVAAPDLDTNPVGVIGKTAADVAAIQKALAERDEREKTATEEARVFSWSQQEFASAVKADATVSDAYSKVYDSFKREAEVYGLKGQDLTDHLAQTEKQHIYFALQNKIPLGDYIKRLAGAKGWTPQAKVAAADPAVTAEAIQQQIDDKTKIQRSAASLTNAGGSPARTGMPSPQELLDMPTAQYDAWRAKHELSQAFSG